MAELREAIKANETRMSDPRFKVGDRVTRGTAWKQLPGGYVVSVLPDPRYGWMYALSFQEGGVPHVTKVGEPCLGLAAGQEGAA